MGQASAGSFGWGTITGGSPLPPVTSYATTLQSASKNTPQLESYQDSPDTTPNLRKRKLAFILEQMPCLSR